MHGAAAKTSLLTRRLMRCADTANRCHHHPVTSQPAVSGMSVALVSGRDGVKYRRRTMRRHIIALAVIAVAALVTSVTARAVRTRNVSGPMARAARDRRITDGG